MDYTVHGYTIDPNPTSILSLGQFNIGKIEIVGVDFLTPRQNVIGVVSLISREALHTVIAKVVNHPLHDLLSPLDDDTPCRH